MFRAMNSCTKEMSFFPSSFMLQTDALHEDAHHQPQTSLNPNFLPPHDLHGIGSFLGKRSLSFAAGIHHHEEICHEESNGNLIVQGRGDMEDMSDDEDRLSQAGGEKKKRLNIEQVKMLEKNFELGNKLEPDRKLQLARYLGLQPRQIAIWFQNRRARWKTKQLEKDYELLKRQFDAIKAENDSLQSQNQKLQAQILALKNRDPAELINLNKETEESCSNTSENSSDVNLDISKKTRPTIDSRSSALFPSSDCDFKQPSNVVHRVIENSNNTDISLSSASRPPDIEPQKVHHHPHHYLHQTVRDESFTNMLCGVDEQAGLWPWFEQNDFS